MLPYRQVHLDFHTSECVPGIGSKFDKEQFQNALKTGHVNSITIFAKCHHGWSYYPTKVNAMHPNLNFDLLGAQLEACKEINVKSPVYLSAGFDERMAREHGDWLIRHPDESLSDTKDFTIPGYHRMCYNTPYLDKLLAEIEEVMVLYHRNFSGYFCSNALCVWKMPEGYCKQRKRLPGSGCSLGTGGNYFCKLCEESGRNYS